MSYFIRRAALKRIHTGITAEQKDPFHHFSSMATAVVSFGTSSFNSKANTMLTDLIEDFLHFDP